MDIANCEINCSTIYTTINICCGNNGEQKYNTNMCYDYYIKIITIYIQVRQSTYFYLVSQKSAI